MKKIVIKIIDTFFLTRLLLLIPVWTVLILGWITGSRDAGVGGTILGHSDGGKELWISLLFFSLIVTFIYIVNQIRDVEGDRINNKLFILPGGYVSIKTAWIISFISVILGLWGAWYFFDQNMLLIFFTGFIVGLLYNLPPVELKNHAFGGTFANLIGHGIITYLVGWYAAKGNGKFLNIDLIYTGLLVSLSAGFANAAVYLTTTIPDAEGDMRIGKKTFAVLYGKKATSVVAAIFCLLSFASAFFLEHNSWVMIIPAALSSFLFIRFIFISNKALAFQTFRWPVILLSFFVSLFVPLYAVLVFVVLIITKIYYKKRFNYNYPNFSGE